MVSSLWVTEKHKNTSLSFKVKNILFKERSKYQLVEIFETYDWGKVLMLDGLMMVTEKDEFFYHETIVHVPLSIQPKAKKVLVIGGGDGGTVRELVKYPTVEKIDLVEIDEMVVEASKKFLPSISSNLDNERVSIKFEDAAEFIKKVKPEEYDLIIADSSDPEGFAACLIETEFYEDIKKALSEDGLFIAQSGSPITQKDELRTTWKNLNSVFSYCKVAWSLTPTYPGSWWSFVIAGKKDINNLQHSIHTPPGCRFWKPELLPALLSFPSSIEKVLN
ncbi:MAG: polyamine aminopropyltransferase [Candidatus Caenarcaniphilales bacterium]|nr:polyamine aminopropyltransferase [Candidatus Caenarcaniphilales bacterium]